MRDTTCRHWDGHGADTMAMAEKLKDTLDPNGILSPGKQGIWPAAMPRSMR